MSETKKTQELAKEIAKELMAVQAKLFQDEMKKMQDEMSKLKEELSKKVDELVARKLMMQLAAKRITTKMMQVKLKLERKVNRRESTQT
jgi:hypothetical protein